MPRRSRRVGPALALLVLACVAPPRAGAAETPLPLLGDESVAATDDASAFALNPAAGGLRYRDELSLRFGGRVEDASRLAGVGSRGGFGAWAATTTDREQRYGLGLRGGEDPLRIGVSALLRVSGRTGEHLWEPALGLLSRPEPWLSLGATLEHPAAPIYEGVRLAREYTLGAGFRPLALSRPRAYAWGPRLTLTADVRMSEDSDPSRARTRFGVEIEPLAGIALRGTFEDHGRASASVVLRAPGWGVNVHRAGAADGDPARDVVAVSTHRGDDASVMRSRADQRVVTMGIGGLLADESEHGIALLGGPPTEAAAPLHRALERALEDPLTRGVLLELDGVSGMAQLEELRPRITRLRAAGKPVVAYLEGGGGRGDLYLASACDRVVASEEAQFAELGLRVEMRYWRRFLADLGVRLDRASVGAYKSAFREYSVDSLPRADRESIERQLDVVQEQLVATVSEGRRIPRERLLEKLDGRSWTARDLAIAGIIDSVGYREQALALLGRLAGLGERPRSSGPDDHPAARAAWTVPGRVAVVYASGTIVEGPSGHDLMSGGVLGSATFVDQIRDAFATPGVEAVVLRVDSPGGSVVASNVMLHAIERATARTHKPLVVSMAGTAASGGYYIAMSGKPILADRMTRTGSIGVLFVKPSFEGFYRRHGVHEDVLERGDAMRAWSGAHDWDAADQASADSAIGRSYRTFVGKVARARGRGVAAVDSVAQGRVWLGEDAVRAGLVDRIGGLEDAIAVAREAAGIPAGERIRTVEFRRPEPPLLSRVLGSLVRDAVTREFGVRTSGGLEYRADDDLAP